jgi:hypothetical protein
MISFATNFETKKCHLKTTFLVANLVANDNFSSSILCHGLNASKT